MEKILKFSTNGFDFTIKTFAGEELSGLGVDFMEELAICYADVFNESWHEDWTKEAALEELSESLKFLPERQPVLSVLLYEGRIVGFSIGCLVDGIKNILDKDMPFALDSANKMAGIERVRYWMNLVSKEKVLVFRELAVRKEFRGNIASFLSFPILSQALENQYEALCYWTNTKSPAFKLGIGCGWYPIHFFMQNDLVLMIGNVGYSFNFIKNVLENQASKESFEPSNQLIKRFYLA